MCFSPKDNFLDLSIFSLWRHCIYNITTPLSSCVYWSYGYRDQITCEAFHWNISSLNIRIPELYRLSQVLGHTTLQFGLLGPRRWAHRGCVLWFFSSDQDWAFKANVLFALPFSTLIHLVWQSWWTCTRFICIKLILKMSSPKASTC